MPLTLKQFKSMQALQRLAPEIKALQEKYKDDKQRLNQEMMKFYQENKVNPFGSCLPLVLQMPVFISLFYMLRKDLKIDICGPESQIAAKAAQVAHDDHAHRLQGGRPRLGEVRLHPRPDATATGGVLIVLLVLYVGSQLLSSLLMSVDGRQEPALHDAGAAVRVRARSSGRFPAGLLVYWITTNLWTVGQQYIIKSRVAHHRRGSAAERRRRADRRDEAQAERRAMTTAPSSRARRGSRLPQRQP